MSACGWLFPTFAKVGIAVLKGMDDWYCGPIPAVLSNKVLADERSEYVDCCIGELVSVEVGLDNWYCGPIPAALSNKVLADERSEYVDCCIGELVSVEVGSKGGASLL
jgi:hypothetical protein